MVGQEKALGQHQARYHRDVHHRHPAVVPPQGGQCVTKGNHAHPRQQAPVQPELQQFPNYLTSVHEFFGRGNFGDDGVVHRVHGLQLIIVRLVFLRRSLPVEGLQRGLIIGGDPRHQHQADNVRRREIQGLPKGLQTGQGGTGAPGLPSGNRGVAEPLRVFDVHLPHAPEQFLLGEPTPAILTDEGLPVGPHDEPCLDRPFSTCGISGRHFLCRLHLQYTGLHLNQAGPITRPREYPDHLRAPHQTGPRSRTATKEPSFFSIRFTPRGPGQARRRAGEPWNRSARLPISPHTPASSTHFHPRRGPPSSHFQHIPANDPEF